MLHHPGKISLGRAQTHMIVVAHDAIGKYFHCPTIVNFTDGLKKPFVVLLVQEHPLPRTSTVHYVIDGSGILNTKRPRHETVTITASHPLSTKDLTPVVRFLVRPQPEHAFSCDEWGGVFTSLFRLITLATVVVLLVASSV